jgi:hypothetical protein
MLALLPLFGGLKVAEHFPADTFKDQFGNTMKITPKDRWICMTFEKSVSKALTKKVKSVPKGFLEKHHVKIISDISSMPSFITSMFALPMMKKYPFSVWLIEDESGKQYDRKKGYVTLYRLKRNKVVSISYLKPDELDRYIK